MDKCDWKNPLTTGSFAWPRSRAYRDVTPFSSLVWRGTSTTLWPSGNTIYKTVIQVRRAIVFKFALGYAFEEDLEDRKRQRLRRTEEGAQLRLKHESDIYARLTKALKTRPSIHVLQPYVYVPEGLFLPLMTCSLEDRLATQRCYPLAYSRLAAYQGLPIPLHLKLRWMKQIASAICWLEQVGLVHGDLHPANVYLDQFENVVLADFGSSHEIGELSRSSAPPYHPYPIIIGDKRSEQYAYAWCLYAIFHGSVPEDFDIISEPDKVVFPETKNLPCGELIQNCWYGDYASLENLRHAVKREYVNRQAWYYRWLDFGCEILARVTLYLRKDWLLREMRRAYDDLREAERNLDLRTVEKGV